MDNAPAVTHKCVCELLHGNSSGNSLEGASPHGEGSEAHGKDAAPVHFEGKGPKGQRRSCVAHGESIKVGCQCHFTVHTDAQTGLSTVIINNPDHVEDHGAKMAISDKPHLSRTRRSDPDERRRIIDGLRIGLAPSALVRDATCRGLAKVLSARAEQLVKDGNRPSDAQCLAADELLLPSQLPVEFSVNSQLVRNIRAKVFQEKHGKADNDATFVHLYAATHEADVLH